MRESAINDVLRAGGGMTLAIVEPEERLEANLYALRKADDTGAGLIYLMARYPFARMEDRMEKMGVDVASGSNAFIDAKTRTVEQEVDAQQGNVMYMRGPQNLTNVSTSISLAANKIETDGLTFALDSLDSLLTYNTEGDVAGFLDDLSGRLDTLGGTGMVFQQAAPDLSIGAEVLQHFDTITFLSPDAVQQAVVQEGENRTVTLRLPNYVVAALDWSVGDELDVSFESEERLSLERKD